MKKKYSAGICFLALCAAACSPRIVSDVNDPRIQDQLISSHYLEVPFYKQKTEFGCGAAALSSVLAYWGIPVSEEFLLQNHPPIYQSTGYSVGEIRAIAGKQGLNAFVLNGHIGLLMQQLRLGRPSIVPLLLNSEYYLEGTLSSTLPTTRFLSKYLSPTYSHYVTVIGFGNNDLLIMDPVLGVRSIDIETFEKMWAPKERAMVLISS